MQKRTLGIENERGAAVGRKAPRWWQRARALARRRMLAGVAVAAAAGGCGGGGGCQSAPPTPPPSGATSLALSLASSPAKANCTAPGAGGAGITAMTITLVHAGDGCAPVTFLRTRGTTSNGTYLVNCSSPQVTTCIETDETLTVPSLDPGSYEIQVDGKIGPTNCWTDDETLDVTAGKALTRTLRLVHQGAPGC